MSGAMATVHCRCRARLSSQAARFAATVALVQSNLVLIGCQTLMEFATWLRAVIISSVVSVVLLAILHFGNSRRRLSWPRIPNSAGLYWARLCIFCFAMNAIPNSGIAVGQLQYIIFTPASYQVLAILSSLSGLCGSLLFAGSFHRSGATRIFVASAALSVVVGLLPLPFALVAIGRPSDHRQDLWSPVGILGAAGTVCGSASTLFTVLPVDTLVTAASCGASPDRSSTSFALLLSFYALGATVGGLVASPFLTAMGLDGTRWDELPAWIIITALLRLLGIVLLPLVPGRCLSEHTDTRASPSLSFDSAATS